MSQWWICPKDSQVVIDDASMQPVDCSSVPINIYLIFWYGTNGEILYNHADRVPLREPFSDLTPYVQLFNGWIAAAQAATPAITLVQAKAVKNAMINALFNSKRQAPYHYPVAAGDYYWDATDATLFASIVPSVQNAIAKINELVGQLNANMPALNNVDASTVSQTNSNIVNVGDSLVTQVIDTIADLNAFVVVPGNHISGEMNGNVIPAAEAADNAIAAEVQTSTVLIGGTNTQLAAPGMSGYPAGIPTLSGACTLSTIPSIAADFLPVSHTDVPWTPVANVPASSSSWIPVGGTAPVPVTPAEAAAIMQGIAARTNSLQLEANNKIGDVNALTTVPDVVAYDITTGW